MTTALVVGATGLVGSRLMRLLAADPIYHRVAVVARRPLPETLAGPGVDQRIFPFAELERHADAMAADHVFCALGTTRRAARSKDAFREVDLEYPRRIARLARANGARHFALVSAIGADAGSRVFYSRVKGEAEDAVRAAGYPGGAIFRPSILGGDRDGRPLERVAAAIMRWAPARWRTIDPDHVAAAMIAVAREEAPGWRVLESHEIRRIGRERVGEGRSMRNRSRE